MCLICVLLLCNISCGRKKNVGKGNDISKENLRRDDPSKFPNISKSEIGKNILAQIKDYNYSEVVELLGENKIDINSAVDDIGNPIINEINYTLNQAEVEKLFSYIVSQPNFDPNRTNTTGENSLFNHYIGIERIKKLVSLGANINQVDFFGSTPLNYAKDIEELRFYLEHESYVKNQKSLNQALMFPENLEVTNYLIEKGAQVSFDQDSRSNLFNILLSNKDAFARYQAIISQVERQGIDAKNFINTQTKIKSGFNPVFDGDTIFHEIVRQLGGASKSSFNKQYQEKMSRAKKIVPYLQSLGGDINIENNAKKSAKDLAEELGVDLFDS